jgi:hypothetical protein
MGVLFANRLKTTLSAGVTAEATVLPLSSVANLPPIGGANYCYLTLVSADQQTIEIVKATAVAGNNVTVTRAQEGTEAVAWAQGEAADLRLTSRSLNDALNERLGVNEPAMSAGKLVAARNISMTGDVIWTVDFDGSLNRSAAGTITAKAVDNTKLADMTIAGLKGATAAGPTTDLNPANIKVLLSISNVENKSSATIRGELTSANVTNALGFTPEAGIAAGTVAQYWRGDKSWQTLDKAAVGLGSVDNTSDANKPVSTAQQSALDAKMNKTPNIQTVASAPTVTPTFANDQVNITALASDVTLMNPTGTPVDGWGVSNRIKDDGTPHLITFDTQYRALGVTLPTTTVAGKTLYIGMIYNAADAKWDVVAVAQEA